MHKRLKWVALGLLSGALTLSAGCQGGVSGIGSQSATAVSVQPTPASPQGTPASPQAAGGSVPDTAPTQAGAPRPTPQPPPPLGQPGREVFTASFSDPARTGLQFLGPPSTSSGVEAGAYWISVGAQWQAGWAAAPGSQGDFIAETDVVPSGNSQERGHGLAFRINQDGNRPPSYYLFWMNPAGPQYALHRVDQGQFNELIAWRRHQALRGEGEPNKMTVRAKGSTLDLYINEQPVASVTDDTIKEGRVALYLSAWSIPGVRTDFLSFKVWQAN